MTISEIIRGLSTLYQYTVLQRADLMFSDVGRYYGGPLTLAQVDTLTEGLGEWREKCLERVRTAKTLRVT